jgi:3-methyladenine DNA glycosylase AlkD
MDYNEIIDALKSHANPENVAGMARFGISTKNTLGVSLPTLRNLARKIGRNHDLAHQLWDSGIHEARILAGLVAEPTKVTEDMMERWVRDFDSWDVCDQCCSNLFDKTRFAYRKAIEWSRREEEFVKRAGFVLMAALSVHDKGASDAKLARFFPIIRREATDERNFVRKAVNWALRQIGKRNAKLNRMAIKAAKQIQKIDSKAAKWIAADALRELTGPAVKRRFRK